MFGKYKRAIFEPPVVIIFTNEELTNYYKFLSEDRWLHLKIDNGELVKHNIHGSDTVIGEKQKISSEELGTNQSLENKIFVK